ncbi:MULTISPECIES: hypothetical protein [Agrobacterium]|uniref:Uncharacterized protein n=1 Tax=Agrobacterium tumefaciens TaxID=358 RepID=A0AAF0H1C9_AGRTU|nr:MULTISPECIES: hypothetical protein [Agrobacterium]WGM61399.1 hypothetical protein CFBP5506_17315 [Agrobacterium tumefaciens]
MSKYLDIATTSSVVAAQDNYGSAEHWARIAARSGATEMPGRQRLGPAEAA